MGANEWVGASGRLCFGDDGDCVLSAGRALMAGDDLIGSGGGVESDALGRETGAWVEEDGRSHGTAGMIQLK